MASILNTILCWRVQDKRAVIFCQIRIVEEPPLLHLAILCIVIGVFKVCCKAGEQSIIIPAIRLAVLIE